MKEQTKIQTGLRLTKEMIEWLNQTAKENDLSQNQLITAILKKAKYENNTNLKNIIQTHKPEQTDIMLNTITNIRGYQQHITTRGITQKLQQPHTELEKDTLIVKQLLPLKPETIERILKELQENGTITEQDKNTYRKAYEKTLQTIEETKWTKETTH